MTRDRAPSAQTLRLLSAFAAAPSDWRHGYDLMTEVGVSSGSLYPILARLGDRGLLESSWEAPTEGRPPRHLYRLTAAGQQEVARLAPSAAGATRAVASSQGQPRARRTANATGGA